MLKKVFWLIPPVVGVCAFALYSGCQPQCVDNYDCRSFGAGYVCSSSLASPGSAAPNTCVKGPVANTDAGTTGGGTDSGNPVTDSGTPGTDSGMPADSGMTTDSGLPTDGGINIDAGIDAGTGCDAISCPTGCCDVVRGCVTNGNRNKACGTAGAACVDCTATAGPTCQAVTNAFCQCSDGGMIFADGGC